MAIIKCKMCGGNLEVIDGISVAECEYCGSRQTVPNVDNEKKFTLFGRANRLRLACEFDKAAGVYENLVAEFPEEAEAYWGLVLCRYGIEYVDDPTTAQKIPTCHRSSFESILEDTDFEQACENADAVARKVYREEAKTIEELRRRILEVSGKEEPYDIFICYKETDEKGERTIDSVLAQDVYDALTFRGYRVFFSRITLEDKLGTEYEPYIFAALNSAKVMLVFGTDYEYFNAVWVKNEWSRFLKLMSKDKRKYLIPCYKNVDAYDIPKEFQKLQAQDLGKVGAVQDLLRGVEKLLGNHQTTEAVKETVVVQQVGGVTADSLLRRGQLFLEESNWDEADIYFNKALDINPECAEAYVGKLCVENWCKYTEDLQNISSPLFNNPNYKKVIRFGSPELKEIMEQYNRTICGRIEEEERLQLAERNKLKELRVQHKRLLSRLIRCCVSTNRLLVGLKIDGTVVAVGDNSKGQCDITDWRDIIEIDCSSEHVVGLRSDGTVVAAGGNEYGRCNISGWKDIIGIVCRMKYTVGLKSDGTVVAVGDGSKGQCNVADWTNIVEIACGDDRTVGLKADGTVVAVGAYSQCSVASWTNIVSIACGTDQTVGLRANGTVVAVGDNSKGQCDVTRWTDIVAVTCGDSYTVGLKNDGTAVAVGENKCGQCSVTDWSDIVAVACGNLHTIGLKADGTVVAVGDNSKGQCNVDGWMNIVAIVCSHYQTVGLKADGTVVTTGESFRGLSEWKLFNYIDTIEQEREVARQTAAAEYNKLRTVLEAEYARLQAELPAFKGLFSGGKRRQIESRLAEINEELRKLQ